MITRYNYEEQFLLYLDNELSQADKLSVEAFVKDNPDMLEELEAFRQCRLIPEEGSFFGNPAPLLKIATTGPLLLPAHTWRMTRVAAAALLLLLIGLIVFIALSRPATAPVLSAPVTITPHNISSPSPQIASSPAQIANATDRKPPQKELPAVTPGTHGALYLATTRRQQDKKRSPEYNEETPEKTKEIPQKTEEIPDEEFPDQALASARISLPSQVTFIDPAITRAPEKIIVAQTVAPEEDSSEDLPAEKNKLRGVFRKISRVLEKTTAQNDNDRHAILIGNLQIAL